MADRPNLDEFFKSLTACRALDQEQLNKAKSWSFDNPIDVSKELIARQWLTKWQARQLLNGKINLFIGKYKISKAIQKNRNYSIFAAHHEQMNRSAVLYVTNQRDNVNDFLKKARQLAALNHPNLQHVYDFDHDGKKCFLVMESVGGEPLVEHLRAGKLDASQILGWLTKLSTALNHMHEAQIAHGSISVSRVLYDASKNAKLIGIAESISADRTFLLNPETLQRDIASWHDVMDELLQGAAAADGQKEFCRRVRADLKVRFGSEPAESFLSAIVTDFSKLMQEFPSEQFDDLSDSDKKKNARPERKNRDQQPPWMRRRFWIACSIAIGVLALTVLIWKASFRAHHVTANKMEPSERDTSADTEPAKNEIAAVTGQFEDEQRKPGDVQAKSESEVAEDKPQPDVQVSFPPLADAQRNSETTKTNSGPSSQAEMDDSSKQPTSTHDSQSPGSKKIVQSEEDAGSNEDVPDEIQNPFAEAEWTVTLPIAKKTGNRSTIELGRVNAEGIKLYADLLGGETAHRNLAEFELRDSGTNRWDIVMRGRRSEVPEEIATIGISDGVFVFQWNPTLGNFSLANHVRNCIVRFRFASFEYRVGMRNDVLNVPPLTVDCWKSAQARRAAIRFSPSIDSMQYEVLEILPNDQEFEILPDSFGPIASPLEISIGKKSQPLLKFELRHNARRPISMVVTPFLKIPGDPSTFQSISREQFLQSDRQIALLQETKKARKKRFDTDLRRRAERGISDEEKENRKIAFKSYERKLKHWAEQMLELKAYCQAMEKTKIRYRVFLPIGEHEIELLRSDPFESEPKR